MVAIGLFIGTWAAWTTAMGGISYHFTDGSGHLGCYSYGSRLLLLGLLAATLPFVRRLGPALTVLPWVAFYLATRSRRRVRRRLATAPSPRTRRAKADVADRLLAPALVCVAVTAASPPSLRMSLSLPFATHHARVGVTAIQVRDVNTTGTALTPHLASRTGQGASNGGPSPPAPQCLLRTPMPRTT